MSIVGQCLFLEYTRGSKSFDINRWRLTSAHQTHNNNNTISIQTRFSFSKPGPTFYLWITCLTYKSLGTSPPSACYDYSRHGWPGLAQALRLPVHTCLLLMSACISMREQRVRLGINGVAGVSQLLGSCQVQCCPTQQAPPRGSRVKTPFKKKSPEFKVKKWKTGFFKS